MNTLKTILVVGVLAAVSYGVWNVITQDVQVNEPEGLPPQWADAPQIEMPGTAGTSLPPTGGLPAAAPSSFGSPATGMPGTAPPAAPAASAGATEPGTAPSAAAADLPATQPDTSGLAGDRYSANPVVQTPGAPVGTDPFAPPPIGSGTGAADEAAAVSQPAPASADFASRMAAVQAQLDEGRLVEAHRALSQLYDDPSLDPEQRREVLTLVSRVAGTVVYSHEHHLLEQPYVVRPGETIDSIAQQYQVPSELLANINGVADPLRPGQQLKVVRGPFEARVDLSRKKLSLWVQQYYAGEFDIACGARGPQPGEWVVREKVPPTDPYNALRAPWLDLGEGVAIHGAPRAQEIQQGTDRQLVLSPEDAANASIAVTTADAEDLYSILSVGSRIVVRR